MQTLKSKKITRIAIVLGVVIAVMGMIATIGVFADNGVVAPAETTQIAAEAADSIIGYKAIAAAVAIALAAGCGGLAMGIIGGKAVEGISRQPEAEGKIRTTFMLGLVFIETAIIYALLVVILIIFVL